MSATISTPTNARKPDSASGYQYLVEKMRLAAEWRDVTFIPIYQQGDVVFYQGNMYIKKNVAANSLVNPASNTNDWISLSDYIYREAGNNLGAINYDNAGVNYKNYLNSLTDAEKINPKVFNAATAAYNIMLDKGITKGGNYSFVSYSKTGSPANSYYEVQFYFQSPHYIQAWAINDAYRGDVALNNYSKPYFYTATQGIPKSYTPVNAIEQLGYTPAKIGDSWISFRAAYTSGAWYLLTPYTFSSSPDLTAFTVNIETGQTSVSNFSFSLKKNGTKIDPINYNWFTNSRGFDTQITQAIIGLSNTVLVTNYILNLQLGGSVTWSYPSSFAPTIDIIIYFSKNL